MNRRVVLMRARAALIELLVEGAEAALTLTSPLLRDPCIYKLLARNVASERSLTSQPKISESYSTFSAATIRGYKQVRLFEVTFTGTAPKFTR
jgi:hypothetical protein